jgi:hypothetical protein
MPTVPNLETPTVQTEPLPGRAYPRLDDNVNPAAFGTGLAAGLEDVSAAVTDEQAKQKLQNDQLRVIDANTQLEAGRTALLYGTPDPQTGERTGGAFSYHGADALNLPAKILPGYQQLASQISSTLTPDQQRLFAAHISAGANDLNLQLNRYEYEESNRLADHTYASAVNQAVEGASVGWRDPIQIGKSRADIKALVDMQGNREGWNQTEKDAQAQKLLAEMHFSVVDRMLADGKPQAALAYFVGTKQEPGIRDSNELTGEQAHQLGSAIDAAIKEGQVQQQTLTAAKVRDVRTAAINGQLIPPSAMPSHAELQAYDPSGATEKAIRADITMGSDMKSLAGLSPAEMQAKVEGYRPTTVEGAAEGYERYNAIGAAAQRVQAERSKDPRQFAIDNQLGSSPINWSDPQAAGQEIRARLASLPQLSSTFGGYVPPLTRTEAGQLAHSWETQTPADRLRSINALQSAVGDDHGFQEIMHQVMPSSPVTAIVGTQLSQSKPQNAPVWFDQHFAPQPADQVRILAGEALVNPQGAEKAGEGKGGFKGAFPLPPDGGPAGLREQYSDAVGDLFRGRPELADAYYGAFKGAYAALLSEKGDLSGNGDGKLRDQALKMVLGNTAEINGRKLGVPPGMDPSRLEALAQNAVAARAKESNAPADWADKIKGYQLLEVGGVGSGRYELVNGNAPLVRPDGRGVFEIDVRNQYLPGHARGTPADVARMAAAQRTADPAAPLVPPTSPTAGNPVPKPPERTEPAVTPPAVIRSGGTGRARPSQGPSTE